MMMGIIRLCFIMQLCCGRCDVLTGDDDIIVFIIKIERESEERKKHKR